MPQLHKNFWFLMFLCTWITLHLTSTSVKKVNTSNTQNDNTPMQTTTSWPWPYT